MQQALQLYPTENATSDPSAAQSRQLRAMDSLNILAFRRGGAAPVPESHDDQRAPVVRALEWSSTDSPIAALIKTDVAQMFRPGLSMKVLWGSISRLCAGGLDGLRMRLVIGSTAAINGESAGCDQSLILWAGDSAEEDDEVYQLSMTDTDDLLGVAGLINEALESRDAFGRLYVLSSDADGLTVLGYFTDREAELLEAHSIQADWV
ncbi:MAG: hypothetical protein P8R54_06660 [Myxococcota bacterium]|nr:hypothetical protein [Myxococcota bacterium]